MGTVTDDNGFYKFKALSKDTCRITASSIGRTVETPAITLTADTTFEPQFVNSAQELDVGANVTSTSYLNWFPSLALSYSHKKNGFPKVLPTYYKTKVQPV